MLLISALTLRRQKQEDICEFEESLHGKFQACQGDSASRSKTKPNPKQIDKTPTHYSLPAAASQVGCLLCLLVAWRPRWTIHLVLCACMPAFCDAHIKMKRTRAELHRSRLHPYQCMAVLKNPDSQLQSGAEA